LSQEAERVFDSPTLNNLAVAQPMDIDGATKV
jgi:hypothetical protein